MRLLNNEPLTILPSPCLQGPRLFLFVSVLSIAAKQASSQKVILKGQDEGP